MRLLRVIASMDPYRGGPCQGIRNATPEMAKSGVLTEVLSLDDPADTFSDKDPFPIHAVGPAQGPWSFSPKLIPWLLENLHQYDVVIIHGLWLYHSYAVRKAMKQLQKSYDNNRGYKKLPKVFVMPHGMLDPYFQRATHRKLKALRNWLYWKFIEEKVVNEADCLLFTCETELRLAREPFRPYHPKKEWNVGYGVPDPPAYTNEMTKVFSEKCPGLKEKNYILFLSRIHNKKGVDLLIKAYIEVSGSMKKSDPAFVLPYIVIAGPGIETAYGKDMQKLAFEGGELGSLIIFAGMLTGDAKWGAFYGCEAFVLPSHQENFGISVVEAMACRKPVLISKEVNIWHEIEAAGGGLVESDTLDGTKRLLKQWFKLTREEKDAMSLNAYQAYHHNFSIQNASVKLVKILKSYL